MYIIILFLFANRPLVKFINNEIWCKESNPLSALSGPPARRAGHQRTGPIKQGKGDEQHDHGDARPVRCYHRGEDEQKEKSELPFSPPKTGADQPQIAQNGHKDRQKEDYPGGYQDGNYPGHK